MASDLQPGDVVWYVDIAEPDPVRAVMEAIYEVSGFARNQFGNGIRLGLYRFHRAREEAIADGAARLDRIINQRRDRIAADREDLWELMRMRDQWGQHGR